MSNTELLVEIEPEVSSQDFQVAQEVEIFEMDHRSQEMLLVLNEVFDSIDLSTKS